MSKSQQTPTANRIPGIDYTKEGNPILTDETPLEIRQKIIEDYKSLRAQKLIEIEARKEEIKKLERALQTERPVCPEATHNCPKCYCRSVTQTGRPRQDFKNYGLTPVFCFLCPYEDHIGI